nr:MAG TPA: hypothetical protein [Caudoviricetes sp.]
MGKGGPYRRGGCRIHRCSHRVNPCAGTWKN